MGLMIKSVMAAAVVGLALAGTGCGRSARDQRPDMDTVTAGDRKVQCADLREMAARLAPTVLACDDITRNPAPITVVVKDMANRTTDMAGQDLKIYVAKLAGLLNTNTTRSRIQFVEEQAVLRSLQAQEVGVPAVDARIVPQYALYGTLYSMRNRETTYYYFEFKLTNLATGAEAWHGDYDVRTLN